MIQRALQRGSLRPAAAVALVVLLALAGTESRAAGRSDPRCRAR